jgi:uncharacterized membrane protein YhhN
VTGNTGSVGAVTAFWILVGLAAVVAAVDWVAVARDDRRLEYLAKPAVLAALTAAAAVLPVDHTDLVDRRWWFVAALACCLVGDVLLMLPGDLFVPGLAAFLAGHVLFIVGLLQPPSPLGDPPFAFSVLGLCVATVIVVAATSVPASLVFRSLVRDRHRELIAPVAVYLVAIATMAVLATNVGVLAAAVGAAFFLVSDAVLAVSRFVRRYLAASWSCTSPTTWPRVFWSCRCCTDRRRIVEAHHRYRQSTMHHPNDGATSPIGAGPVHEHHCSWPFMQTGWTGARNHPRTVYRRRPTYR